MKDWQLQEAKQRFSELIRAVEDHGPQSVTKHGRQVAVVVDVSTFQQLSWEPEDFKAYLLAGPQVDDLEIERDDAPARVVHLG